MLLLKAVGKGLFQASLLAPCDLRCSLAGRWHLLYVSSPVFLLDMSNSVSIYHIELGPNAFILTWLNLQRL